MDWNKVYKKIEEAEFEKVYTRDTSAIIQQAWVGGLWDVLKNLRASEHLQIGVVHYINNGVIEVWENVKYTNYFSENLLAKNKKGSKFFDKHTSNYLKMLSLLKKYNKQNPSGKVSICEDMIDSIFEGMLGFVVMYYSAVNEKTPKIIREKALKMRDKDNYFYLSDKLIRENLINLYPYLSGLETTILRNEIKDVPLLSLLKKRKKNFVFIGELINKSVSLLDFAKEFPKLRFKKDLINNLNTSEIKGLVAFKGSAKGKVKLLRRNEQIDEVKKGVVIVSSMTTPAFLPAMKKASAFITDEGGITCHASIVARELKKPCIIGTRVATKVLKDGDLVEVDANKGTVKIISKK